MESANDVGEPSGAAHIALERNINLPDSALQCNECPDQIISDGVCNCPRDCETCAPIDCCAETWGYAEFGKRR